MTRPAELDPLERGAVAAHEGSEMRTERCACGVDISAANNPGMIQAAVAVHNESAKHQEWRAVHALQRPTRRKCPCHEGAA